MGRSGSSPSSSSIDSSSNPILSSTSTSSFSHPNRPQTTDLTLGLSLSASHQPPSSLSRDQYSDWPPIKPLLRNTLTGKGSHRRQQQPPPPTFFVKVYMDGIQIGRKVDLSVHDDYEGLIRTLQRMFRATILRTDHAQASSNKDHVLTYEDKEGDWMLVGDVPWETTSNRNPLQSYTMEATGTAEPKAKLKNLKNLSRPLAIRCTNTRDSTCPLPNRPSNHQTVNTTQGQVEFWICLVLTILGYLPGIIYAIYAITK
ncbi:Auxin-responsive protein IAA4 [Acorus calamus]|uniref:Auxin-responsive protein n=1 Tax=Acorus calamus TaxID=4465 RepID=A0AAV9CYF9_ACOCL|nr:Auxin-responsive protein IAA4 [Acorus calamus]